MLNPQTAVSQTEMLVQRIRPLGNAKRAELFRLLAQKGVDLARLPIVPLAERPGKPVRKRIYVPGRIVNFVV